MPGALKDFTCFIWLHIIIVMTRIKEKNDLYTYDDKHTETNLVKPLLRLSRLIRRSYTMSPKKKKQHYVPQCYLENWAIDGSHQIYVYDKEMNKQRKNNITDVASENYFYDVDLTGIVTNDKAKEMGFSNFDPSKADEAQYIENFFSNSVEGQYKFLLNNVLTNVSRMTPWELKNCSFFSA